MSAHRLVGYWSDTGRNSLKETNRSLWDAVLHADGLPWNIH